MRVVTFLCFSLWLWIITFIDASSIEKKLLSRLFRAHNPRIRPVINENTITYVTLNMRILQLISIDEKHQQIKIHCFLQIRWKNEHLNWNPHDWGNVTYLNIHRKDIWTPDFVLLNSGDKDGFKMQKGTDTIRLDYNGSNAWFPKVLVTATFKTNTKYFPFDSQRFYFRFESWSFPEDKLRILKDNQSVVDKHYVNSTIWDLNVIKKELSTQRYGKDETYSDLSFVVRYSRRPSYFVVTVILPCIILVLTVLFTFFLPVACYGKMYVLVILLLGYTVFLELVASSLPNTNSTPLILVYILIIIINCSVSFLITCIVKSSQYKILFGVMTHPLPRLFRKYIMERDNDIHKADTSKDASNSNIMLELDIFPGKTSNALKTRKSAKALFLPPKQLHEILNTVKRISYSIDKKDQRRKIQSEWMQFAKMIDKINFWVFSSISILSHFVIFLGYKRYY